MMSMLQIEILQEVFDHIADHMLYVTDVPKAMFDGIDLVEDPLQYPIQYRWDERFLASPTFKLASRFGDTYMDELADIANTTVADVLKELQSAGLKRLPYLGAYEKLAYTSNIEKVSILAELVSMIIDFENVFANQPTDKWAEAYVTIAKLRFLRWDRPFLARKLLPELSVEPVVESRTATLINSIESQGYKPIEETELGPKGPTGMPGYYADSLKIVDMTQPAPNPGAQALLDKIRARQKANATPSTLTQQVMDKLVSPNTDPFFSKLGDYFTFVTEQSNPTLKYGQLTKKEVIYSIDNPEGDVFFVFEVIDERGYIEPERVTSLERAIVCKGDQIHYTDFNKVVKTMLRRLDL